nr:DUF433 domain-containing protein [Nitrosomonas nitrosa]
MIDAVWWPESIELLQGRPVDKFLAPQYGSVAASPTVKYEPCKVIVRTEGICGGSPRIEGTRIPVRLVASLNWQGETVENIAMDYDLSLWQVRQAIEYASQHEQEIRDEIRSNELA